MNKPEKANIIVKSNYDFIRNYNGPFRIIVDKPVVEKYARKLAQDYLHNINIFGNLIKLYEHSDGVDSEQPDKWVFGLQIYPSDMLLNGEQITRALMKVAEDDE